MRPLHLALTAVATFALAGCASMGPMEMSVQRGNGPEIVSYVGEEQFKQPAGWAVPGEPSGFVEFYLARGSLFQNTTVRRGAPEGLKGLVYSPKAGESEIMYSYKDSGTDHVRFAVPAGQQFFALQHSGGQFIPLRVSVEPGKITPVSVWWARDKGLGVLSTYTLDAQPFRAVDVVSGPLQRQRHPRSE
jgi:hypothetical protein